MFQFFLRRLTFVLFILFFVSLIVFAVTELLPGDAAQMILGQKATPATLTALRVRLGLDQPAPVRYLAWIGGVLRGDWGESLIIFPPFVIAVFLIIVFSLWLHWLPASSMIEADANLFSSLRFLILPTLTLTLGALAEVARLTRASLIEVVNSDYIRTAKSKGLPSQLIVWRHALRNALLPVISVLALNIGYLMSGTVLVESVFAYPGLGRLLLQAISQRDLPLLQGVALITAAIYTLANLAADLAYRWLNPRIRYS